MISQVAHNKSSMPITPHKKSPSIQELKQKYERQVKGSPRTVKPTSPKLLKKLKVRKMATMFNSELDEEKRKTALEKLFEEAIVKLERVEIKQNEESLIDSTSNNAPTLDVISSESSTTSSAKHSEAEENTSDESPTESSEHPKINTTVTTATKPMRKKKLRRSLSWKKDSSLVATNTISTTDSETDCKNVKHTSKKTINKQIKSLTDVKLDESLMCLVNTPELPYKESSLERRRQALLADMSGVRKILTSNPNEEQNNAEPDSSLADSFDQGFETGSNEVDSPVRPSRKSIHNREDKINSPLFRKFKPTQKFRGTLESNFSTPIKSRGAQNLSSAFNEVGSPIRQARRSTFKLQDKIYSPLLIKLAGDSYQATVDMAQKIAEIPSNFSTPIKSRGAPQNLSSAFNEIGVQQQIFSPICMPVMNLPANEINCTFTTSQSVISEDQSLEPHDNSDNNTTFDMTNANVQNSSSFWIKSGDFSIVLDIYKYDPECMKLLYEIFSQRSSTAQAVHFGIDGHRFSACKANDEGNISKCLSQNMNASQYWFSTGDMIIPFSGKFLSSEKILRLFEFVKASVEETGVLRFGVDELEFSNVAHSKPAPISDLDRSNNEFVQQDSRSRCDLDQSNNLSQDIRCKYAGPHSNPAPVSDLDRSSNESNKLTQYSRSRCVWSHMKTVPVSDLDHSNNESARHSLAHDGRSKPVLVSDLDQSNNLSQDSRSRSIRPQTKPMPISDLDQSNNESARQSLTHDSRSRSVWSKSKPVAVSDLDRSNNESNNRSQDSRSICIWPHTKTVPVSDLDRTNNESARQSLAHDSRCKYTSWSHSKPVPVSDLDQSNDPSQDSHSRSVWHHTKPAPVSDLDHSNNESARQLLALDSRSRSVRPHTTPVAISDLDQSNFKGSDFEENASAAHLPPENELQKSHDHNPAALSEHQLRIQASLQRLNIPDWFRQYNQKSPEGAATGGYKPGNFTRKRTQDSGRWAGLNSKTTSLSSLGSQRSDRSPLLLSPSAHSHHGGQSAAGHGQQVHGPGGAGPTGGASGGASGGAFSRWSTSHLNSSQTSPSVSQRGSFSRGGPINSSFISVNSGHSVIRNSMRQPYMGWRSQEKLSQRTAHERLASSMLSQQQQQQQRTSPTTQTPIAASRKLQPVTPEIQSSIKEVTSAIVHYVNDQTNQQRSRSTSPNSRKCWLESSFVGIRPLDSPQTPVIENTPFIAAVNPTNLRPLLNSNNNNNYDNTITSNSFHIAANHNIDAGNTAAVVTAQAFLNSSAPLTGNDLQQLTRMNGGLNNGATSSSSGVGVGVGGVIHYAVAPERSLSNASLEDVLASLLGLPTHPPQQQQQLLPQQQLTGANHHQGPGSSSLASDAFARSSTGGVIVSDLKQYMPPKQTLQQQPVEYNQQQQQHLLGISKEEQQRLRRRSEGDAPAKQKQQQQLQQQQHQQLQQQQHPHQQQQQNQNQQQLQLEQKFQHQTANAKAYASDTITTLTHAHTQMGGTANGHAGGVGSFLPPRRVSLGDSSESNNRTTTASGELQVKCRNNKCDRTAAPLDAKKYYKSCHNCTYLYCSRECRRAHWEKHRKACLHSRVSNLCRQVLASCKDDSDSLRHLSLLARKGFLSQGRGVVRILFRSPESAEGFIKNGFQCMGEASYVRWPDLMPAEMGLELYSELLKLSTEYRPDSKMLVYVAVCVVSEAPSMGQAPVRWERQLVSRCAKLKLCKSVLAELDQLQQQPPSILQQPITMVAVPEPTTEVLILTFNPQLRSSTAQREMVLSNILDILSRRGVILRKHYPEIFQRFQTYTEGQTDKINPVTLHPRDSHTGQNFVCIIMPVQSDTEIIKLPSMADGGNRVTTIDVGSPTAVTQMEDDELLTRTTAAAS